jgi:hypothetical protein
MEDLSFAIMKTGKVKFGDLTAAEIERREKAVNSIILFTESGMEVGIEFQKSVCTDGEAVLCIQADSMKGAVILFSDQINELKRFLGQ